MLSLIKIIQVMDEYYGSENAHKKAIEKISKLKLNDRKEFLRIILENRENRLKEAMKEFDHEEAELKGKQFNQKNTKMLENSFKFTSSSSLLLTADAKKKLDCSFHYHFYDQNNQKEDSLICSICVKQFELKEKVTVLSCDHHFHTECIEKWFSTKAICPNCRAVPQQKKDEHLAQLNELYNKKMAVKKRNQLMIEKMKMFLMDCKEEKKLY